MPSSRVLQDQAGSADARAIDPKRFRWLIWALYKVSCELERMFPGRSFVPEGRVADDLAASVAEAHYDLGGLTEATASDPVPLLVKSTQGGKVYLQDCPAHLLVIRLYRDGSFEEVYNGPGDLAWELAEAVARQSKGPWAVRLPELRKAMQEVPDEKRLARIQSSRHK